MGTGLYRDVAVSAPACRAAGLIGVGLARLVWELSLEDDVAKMSAILNEECPWEGGDSGEWRPEPEGEAASVWRWVGAYSDVKAGCCAMAGWSIVKAMSTGPTSVKVNNEVLNQLNPPQQQFPTNVIMQTASTRKKIAFGGKGHPSCFNILI